ncbi:MAG: hypothetical protein ACXAC8_15965 [Candidatus Hodarchaeales archaeon]|jgi:hypothetical protein
MSFSLIISILILLAGLLYFSFTFVIFPQLVPGYGAGEPFQLNENNNYTTDFPWYANSRLHLTIKANNSVQIIISENLVHNGSSYELTIEPNDYRLITLISNSSVSGRFSAWQEVPIERQVGTVGFLTIGIAATMITSTLSFISRKNQNFDSTKKISKP